MLTIIQKTEIRTLLDRIKRDGYIGISIEFDGSGDSGDFNNIYIHKENFNIDEEYVNLYNIEQYNKKELECLIWLARTIDKTYNVDWTNNDGGYGNINIDLNTGDIQIHYNIRYIDYHYYTYNTKAKKFTR